MLFIAYHQNSKNCTIIGSISKTQLEESSLELRKHSESKETCELNKGGVCGDFWCDVKMINEGKGNNFIKK